MRKQFALVTMLATFVLGLALIGCGTKRDENLVTEFNSKKAEADKVIADDMAAAKQMSDDHKAWLAKLDDAAKDPKADTAKINMFRAQIKKMDDMMPAMNAMHDSLKTYANAKTDNNDQLNAAIAGLNAQLAMCTSSCSKAMDDHKKLGADIMAFLSPAAPAADDKKEPEKKEEKKAAPAAQKQATPPPANTTPKLGKRGGGGGTVKQ